jgi:hypothetical protein
VSTFSFKSEKPSKLLAILFCPSKENGLVTTHTVKAHSSLAISATTGAAQVPVPHPRPQVMKTISAPASEAFISSLDSSAALAPISGSEPAPNHPVIILPMFSFVEARELYKA